MDLFDTVTYRFNLLCVDGVCLCVHRLWDLQGFELRLEGTFVIKL